MIQRITLENASALDAFVEKNGSFFQSSLWGRVKSDWGWHGLICRDATGKIRGTMAILEHRIHRLNRCLLYAPRGPVALDMASAAELILAARALGRERRAFVLRLDPPIDESDAERIGLLHRCGFRQRTATDFSLFQARYNYMIDLTDETEQTLLMRYHPSMRRNVRLAEQNGLEVCYGTVSDLEDFCELMQKTAEKNGFKARSKQYFYDILTKMPENAMLYLAKTEERTIAATIMVRFGRTASFFYGCSDPSYLQLHPNELLQYRMQCDAINCGCTVFDLRGVEGEPKKSNPKFGLHCYKIKLGATLVRYAGEFDMILSYPTYILTDIINAMSRISMKRVKEALSAIPAAIDRLFGHRQLSGPAPSEIPSRH